MNNEPKSENGNGHSQSASRLLYIFTRTPLHVGAGSSVGAIDQPIIRERHTGFPVIPATSLKGTFADAWNDGLLEETDGNGKTKKVRVKKDGTISDAAWLFGSDSNEHAAAGALQFLEARLLAFPIRSAKGSFAWITCPLMLRRAVRDGVFAAQSENNNKAAATVKALKEPNDEQAIFASDKPLGLDGKIILEQYTFQRCGGAGADAGEIGVALAGLLAEDPVGKEIANRLVILSNGMLSFFVQNACEVAQHVRISDETGTAEDGALFNQENVPSETLFYSTIHAFTERAKSASREQRRDASKALDAFSRKIEGGIFQFGGDASTGLGYCSVKMS
ncbi:MAG: type III-B CRISPR module RAMP protein Cmr4 [Limisphaerales bacterium]